MKLLALELTNAEHASVTLAAEAVGQSPREFARAAIGFAIMHRETPLPDRVALLHSEGATVAEIARATHETNARIQSTLRRLSLKANRKSTTESKGK